MECDLKPNGTCPHAHKDFEQLKKDFPYFGANTLSYLQKCVCNLCKSEWDIPRFKNQI